MIICGVLFLVAVFFTMTQLREIHVKAAGYLIASTFAFLAALSWQCSIVLGDTRSRRLCLLPILSLLMVVFSIAVMVSVQLSAQGLVREWSLAAAAYMQVLPGLFWGLGIGCMIQQFARTHDHTELTRWLTRSSFVVALIIGTGIFIGTARLIPSSVAFASDRDERHQTLVQSRDSGQSRVELPFLLHTDPWDWVPKLGEREECAEEYYGIDDIVNIPSAN